MNLADIDEGFAQFRHYFDGAQCVLFFESRGERVLRCYLTLRALVSHFGVRDDIDDANACASDCLSAFDREAERIRGIARGLIDADGQPLGDAVVITADDVCRALFAPAAAPVQ
ncbi:MAG: DUF1488 family protein [Burkholderiaceae bacterium]